MTTATATSTSAKSKAGQNGVSRQIKAIQKRAATGTRELQAELTREGRAITRRAGALVASATRATREHPWTAASVVAVGAAALIGGYLWAQRR